VAVAMIGVIGLSFDSVYANTYTLDQSFCISLGGTWTASTCTMDENDEVMIHEGIYLEIPHHILLVNDGVFNTYGIIRNYGIVENNFILSNYGTINNYDTGIIDSTMSISNGDRNSKSGTINNSGTINIISNNLGEESYSVIQNEGTINNDGTINSHTFFNNNYIFNNKNTFNNDGLFTNGGNFNNDATSILENTGTINNLLGSSYNEIITNSGTINNYGTFNNDSLLMNPGTFNNYDTGIVDNKENKRVNGNAGIINRGTFNNDGTINNKDAIVNFNTINNDGIIIMADNTRYLMNLDSGTINNYGTIYDDWNKIQNEGIINDSVITKLLHSEQQSTQKSSEGGGCLIATATYGSEMAPQVQQLRELRDNQLLNTESGTAFMSTFNDIYYSFSPVIADYERENPYFKEAVKLAITPMISSLSLMNNAETESEVLGIGISVIALNLGMYLGVPAVLIVGIRKIR